jgi:hypothetical protein
VRLHLTRERYSTSSGQIHTSLPGLRALVRLVIKKVKGADCLPFELTNWTYISSQNGCS